MTHQDELSRLRTQLELVAMSALPVKGGLKNLSDSELIAWKDGIESTSAVAAEIAKRTLVAFDTLRAEVAVLREALGPLARQAALCGNASPEMIIGLIGGVENALRRKDADRAARVLSSTSPSPILAEIARLREALVVLALESVFIAPPSLSAAVRKFSHKRCKICGGRSPEGDYFVDHKDDCALASTSEGSPHK